MALLRKDWNSLIETAVRIGDVHEMQSSSQTSKDSLIRDYRKKAAYAEQQGETQMQFVYDSVADDLEGAKTNQQLTSLIAQYRKNAAGSQNEDSVVWNDAADDIKEMLGI